MQTAKCRRAMDYKNGQIVYCGKSAEWIVIDHAHGDREFGLCDAHLTEMSGLHPVLAASAEMVVQS